LRASGHAERQRSNYVEPCEQEKARYGNPLEEAQSFRGSVQKQLAVQRDVEFGSKLAGIEWAAGEVTAADLNGGDFALAVVHADDEVFGVGIVFDVHFAKFDTAIFQERFCAAAIGTPDSAVDCDRFHRKELTP
jgi:hypothetical protein